jgi:hypothetical protein
MPQPAHRIATYDDLLALPEHVNGEIIDGELVVSRRPAPRHANATGGMFGQIQPCYGHPGGGERGPGGWIILFEPELHLGRDIVVPDLAGWRRERMPSLPETPYLTLARIIHDSFCCKLAFLAPRVFRPRCAAPGASAIRFGNRAFATKSRE